MQTSPTFLLKQRFVKLRGVLCRPTKSYNFQTFQTENHSPINTNKKSCIKITLNTDAWINAQRASGLKKLSTT